MFIRKNRATTLDVKNAQKSGTTRHSTLVSVRITPHPHTPPRFAVVVSKKVASRAVDRNRIKRRIREIIKELPAQDGHTYVVYTKKGIASATNKEIYTALHHTITA